LLGALHIVMLTCITSSSPTTQLPAWFKGPTSKVVTTTPTGEPIFRVGLFETQGAIDIRLNGRFSIWYPRKAGGVDISHIETSDKARLKVIPKDLPRRKRIRRFPAVATEDAPDFSIGWQMKSDNGVLNHQQGYRWVQGVSAGSQAPDGSARKGQIHYPKSPPLYPVRFSLELATGLRLAAFQWVLIVPEHLHAPGPTLKANGKSIQPRGAVLIMRDTTSAVTAISLTPSESIVRGVVPAELFASAPSTALEAQAVAARTALWAMAGHRHFDRAYHVCADVHCQVYGGVKREQPSTDLATSATRGMTLLDSENRLADAVFSSSCGGHTEANDNVWGGTKKSYLKGVSDIREDSENQPVSDIHRWVNTHVNAYCTHHRFSSAKFYRWKRIFNQAKLWRLASETFPELRLITGVEVLKRGVSGRAIEVRVTGLGGRSRTLGPELTIRRAFGGLPSAAFEILQRVDGQGALAHLEFRGAGFGHGVGMCQMGAIGRAIDGQSARDILGHYYPGTKLQTLHP